jgi:hypothetical protein
MVLRGKLCRLSPGGFLGGVWWFPQFDLSMVVSVRPLEEWLLHFAPPFSVNFSIQQQVLAPGRCVAASISDGNNSSSVVSTHNYALTRVQVQHIGPYLSSIAAKVRDDPSNISLF